MADKRLCKICGKPCPNCKLAISASAYRWQDVACSVEHGEEYLAAVLKSRGGSSAEPAKKKKKKENADS